MDNNDKVKILFIGAAPNDATRLRLDKELKKIQEKLKSSKFQDKFILNHCLAAIPTDISKAFLNFQPNIVHLSCHGTKEGELVFEDQFGGREYIKTNILAALCNHSSWHIKCVLLNACNSTIPAEEIAKYISYTIGMNKDIGDQAAIAFSTGFYQAIGAGTSIDKAFEFGRLEIGLESIPEYEKPKLFTRKISTISNYFPKVLWELTLEGNYTKEKEDEVELIFSRLYEIVKDESLEQLKVIHEGSIKILLRGAKDKFENFKGLFELQTITKILGVKINSVQSTELLGSPIENSQSSGLEILDSQDVDTKSSKQLVHPIIIYPFNQPENYSNLQSLYQFVEKICENYKEYSRPITVLNRQTYYKNINYKFDKKWKKRFVNFLKNTVQQYSDVILAWSVDSCQMWLHGLGHAFDNGDNNENQEGDVYWLIPGDFNYSSDIGQKILQEEIENIPKAVRDHQQDFCIGEIKFEPSSSKKLIDTYGTYALLNNWFPWESQKIQQKTDNPRSKFWAINHSFLREILLQRWYAYEQTMVILLHAIIRQKQIYTIELGNISDLPQGRDSLAAAMQQVERTERVLKLFWRENTEKRDTQWPDTFRKLDAQSEQILGAALVILENLLG